MSLRGIVQKESKATASKSWMTGPVLGELTRQMSYSKFADYHEVDLNKQSEK